MLPACLITALALGAAPELTVSPASVTLRGTVHPFSLLVSTVHADGTPVDVTRRASYRSANPAIATVSERGVIRAIADGVTQIHVSFAGAGRQVEVRVSEAGAPRQFHFVQDIVPLLNRFGCNGSGCHGKAEGQGGLKLSVFGFDPLADHASLVLEARGRRVFPAAPEASLLVRKMSGQSAHGGGARIRAGSAEFDTIVGWIRAGMPFGAADAPQVVQVRVEPSERVLAVRGQQQLRVMARLSDGRTMDVTAHARFQSNNEALAGVDAEGLVTAGEVPGVAAILASFMDQMDTCRVLIPRSERLASYPELRADHPIDRLVNDRLRKLHIVPSGLCDDATFLRRAYLDVIGTLPTVAEARRFLADRRPDRRARLVDELLARPEFADYWTLKWADVLRVDRAALGAKQARAYHAWIRRHLAQNTPLDQLARELITSEGPVAESPGASFYKAVKKPGEMAGTFTQVFLGVRIACAECHHHPFDRWGQEDYHAITAYFNGLQVVNDAVRVVGSATAKHPRSGATILARPLGEPAPEKAEQGDRRETLAAWLTRPSNPYFARNLANRVWAHLLGRGLIEPLDDVRATNPPSNPELLDALAQQLIAQRYDLRALIRHITASDTYQRTTTPNATNEKDSQNYSRAALRRVPAEVLLDMVSQATGVPERFRGMPPGTRAIELWDSKVPHYFLKAFGRTERTSACECERVTEPSVAQVLHLLNAPEIEAKLTHAGGTVARLTAREADPARLVEELYLTYFARLPSAAEQTRAVEHLRANPQRRREAVEDLAWSLLNTLEFSFNH
ncbi:MAG: DUF1553 domain-containing protein [Gemmataceae bacterium]